MLEAQVQDNGPVMLHAECHFTGRALGTKFRSSSFGNAV